MKDDFFDMVTRAVNYSLSFSVHNGAVDMRLTEMGLRGEFFECRATGQRNGVEWHELSSLYVDDISVEDRLCAAIIRAINAGIELVENNDSYSVLGMGFVEDLEAVWCRIECFGNGRKKLITTEVCLSNDNVRRTCSSV